MKLLILESKNPYINLAIEEYLFLSSVEDIFMLWQNEPTVVIGKNQNAFAEINTEYVKEKGIHIARRITGGGAVYHDLGNVNYTFISKRQSNSDINFDFFTQPIIELLKKEGINAKLSGRNDILVEDKKISGNAQHTKGDRVLHHGTLLFDSDLSILSKALNVDEEKIKAKAIKSLRSRVANLKPFFKKEISVSDFINMISEYIQNEYSAELIMPLSCDMITELSERNASREWIYPTRDFISNYTVHKKRKFDFGLLDIYMYMSNDRIDDIKIYGDFFGAFELRELIEMIKNKKLSELSLILSDFKIENYIFGMTKDLFIDLLTN